MKAKIVLVRFKW